MHFDKKNILKSNRNHTIKQARMFSLLSEDLENSFFYIWFKIIDDFYE